MGKKVGVLLSGCGVFDGSEIHEAVLTMLSLDKAGAEIIFMAPNTDQLHVINHLTQETVEEKRNILQESARIARGDIKDLQDVHATDLDALVIPGGYGAAKNLSDFGIKGPDASVHPEVDRLLQEMVSAGKPVGALCIAPATVAKSLSNHAPEVTIGHDQQTAANIETMGARHIACNVDAIHVDWNNKLVTTPAYMLETSIKEVAVGIDKLVNQVMAMTD